MDKNESLNLSRHQVSIVERKNIVLTGIKKVISFDSEKFILDSNAGNILLKGTGLEIVKLNTDEGNVSIKGTINGLNYIDDDLSEKKESMLSKLFK